MSGGSVPYHLRQNKSVERGVFIDLLQMCGRSTPISIRDYRYIGFAGPFSEDFKLAHSHLGLSRFVSIEMDQSVLKRQKWNTPIKGIDYRHLASRDYVDTHDSAEPSIVWLDYAIPKDIRHQLAELQSLVSKASDHDIVKVTFNATPSALGHDPNNNATTTKIRVDCARDRLGAFLPVGFDVDPDDVTKLGFPRLILKAAENAIKLGMQGKPKSSFQLLTTFVYSDSEHRMLTLTGIILPVSGAKDFLKNTGIKRWGLATTRWGDPRTTPLEIAIPEMSLRERLFVDQQLPRRGSSAAIMRRMGFRLGTRVDEETIKALGSYGQFYRYFPYFSKMTL